MLSAAETVPVTKIAAAALALALVVLLASCGSGSGGQIVSTATPQSGAATLASADVMKVITNAMMSVNVPLVVAVVDRQGNILAVARTPDAPANSLAPWNFSGEQLPSPILPSGGYGKFVDSRLAAVGLARTAAFFSNNQAPLSSRTVRFISGIHFPPGVSFTSNADLYGIENTNRGCENLEFPGRFVTGIATSLDGSRPGLGIVTGKGDRFDSDPIAVNPGGVPLFQAASSGLTLLGGVGVVAVNDPTGAGERRDVAEYAAFTAAAASNLLPTTLPPPGIVVIGGIELPFVNQQSIPSDITARTSPVSPVIEVPSGGLPLPGKPATEGYLLGPTASASSAGLTRQEVNSIVMNAVATANITRAVIRLPQASRTKMSIAVSDVDGTLLAVYRMPDGTIFSLDVASTKARNVVWFSSPAGFNRYDPRPGSVDLQDFTANAPGVPAGTAITNRTISFGSMPLFPPGIDGSLPGPFFSHLYLNDTAHPCTQGTQAANLHQSGIVFFPGSLPLYRNGQMVGGLGVSGDGVDQDDFVTAAGAKGYEADPAIRADQVVIRNVRLPYLKFPRNPTN